MTKPRLYKYSEYVHRPGDKPVRNMRSVDHGGCWRVESRARNERQNYVFLIKQVFATKKGEPGIYGLYWVSRDDGYDDPINPYTEYPWDHRPIEGPFKATEVASPK
jgi:hypothetical protein